MLVCVCVESVSRLDYLLIVLASGNVTAYLVKLLGYRYV